jgi:FtsP/CotA-like multicopper oxidase with cupredoxin domain
MPLLSARPSSLGSGFTRRGLLLGSGAAGLAAVASRPGHTQAVSAPTPDHTIQIAPLEIAPGKIIKTTAHNGTVPGPALRLQEGRAVAINVRNDSG